MSNKDAAVTSVTTPAAPITTPALAEPSRWELEVVGVAEVTPHVRRVQVRADGLGGLGHRPGQDLMLSVPTGDGGSIKRRYTVRRLDPVNATVDLDIVRHGDGPGARWAATVVPGERVEGVGPRGKITVAPHADWHLFAGDDSAVPAIAAMVESLEAGQRALVFLEVDSPADRQPVAAGPGVEASVTWLYRGDDAPGTGHRLLDAMAGVSLPNGPGHAYLAGESRQVAAWRQALIERGLDADQLSAKAYWRAGQANAGHGEPARD